MADFALILFAAIVVNNFVLTQMLGVSPFVAGSRKLESAIGTGLSTAIVLTLASVSSFVVDRYLLSPLNLEYLRLLVLMMIIVSLVQIAAVAVRKIKPEMETLLGPLVPLITVNSAVLGVALLTLETDLGLAETAVFGFGCGLGFALTLALFAAVRLRVDAADVPGPFRGAPIALITAGLASLAFLGFAGILRG